MPRPSSAAATASSTSRSTARRPTPQKVRGAGRRSCGREGSRIRSDRWARPSRRRNHPAGSAARRSRRTPGCACTQYPLPIRIVYTDQDLRTSYTHHFSVSLQRQLGRNLAVEGAYVGKIGRDLVGHNYFNAAPFINSPITGLAAVCCRTSRSGCRSVLASSARSRVCSATSSTARTTACSCGSIGGWRARSRSRLVRVVEAT